MAVSFVSSSDEFGDHFVKDILDMSSPKEVRLTSNGFFNLPREIQVYLFSFFTHKELCTTLAPVCQDWWKLSKDPSLWQTLEIEVRREDETPELASLLLRMSMLTVLKITSKFSLVEFAQTAHACPKLKYLELKDCEHFDLRIFAVFAENCPLIEELYLRNCSEMDKKLVSDIALFRHLRALILSPVRYAVEDDFIQLLSEECRQLEDLDISEVCRITNSAVCSILENLCSTLRRLELNGYDLTDVAFESVGLCTKLEYLSVVNGYRLTEQTLAQWKKLTSLQTLKFGFDRSVPAGAVNDFFMGPHVRNLVALELTTSNIDDDGVYKITQNCKLLQSLYMWACLDVTDVGLEHILRNCSNLVSLFLKVLPKITGKCLLSIPESSSKLLHLYFQGCFRFDQSVLDQVKIRLPEITTAYFDV